MGQEHRGIPGVGTRIVKSSHGNPITINVLGVSISDLEIDMNGYGDLDSNASLIKHSSIIQFNAIGNVRSTFDRLLLHDLKNNRQPKLGDGNFGITVTSGIYSHNTSLKISNSLIYNIVSRDNSTNTSRCVGIYFPNVSCCNIVANCTIYKIIKDISGQSAGIFYSGASNNIYRNNISVMASGSTPGYRMSYGRDTIMAGDFDYCMSDDETAHGDNSITNVNLNRQFVSTVDGLSLIHI